jgi:peptide/nickel transport system substrate-binding protein
MAGLVRRSALLFALMLVAGCAAPATRSVPANDSASQAPAQPAAQRISRTLVMAGRSESPSVASRPLRIFGLTSTTVSRLFNAGLALRGGDGTWHPYLADSLPQVNSDTWKVNPDGTMETTYRLKPNLTWHDGAALTADDFVFSYQIYSNPEVGQAGAPPISQMSEVLAPDSRTVVIRWREPFADAGNLEAGSAALTNALGFPPLPRHVLESQFRQGNIEAFVALPFWSTEYVGAGPYKMERWEPGAYFEGAAFDQHVLGRPKIERVRMLFIPDFNTSVANMLTGEAHITVDDSIRFQQALVLRREWEPKRAGTVLVYPALWRHTYFQHRPELARPVGQLDTRVRKALAHSVDKTALNDALFEGEGILTETPIPPTSSYFAEVDRAATKYPYDVRRTEQLMAEAGYAKGGDGIWAHPAAGRFEADLTVLQSPQNENEMHVMASVWRQVGFDIAEKVWAANLASDGQLRDTHPGLANTSAGAGAPGEVTLAEHTTPQVPSAQNRWAGYNRGGWTNAEFDTLSQRFNTSLIRADRTALLVQMAKIFSDDAAVIALYFNPTTTAFVSNLKGPKVALPEGTMSWDIYDWEWTS